MRLWESSLGSVLGIKRVLDIVLSGIALILGFPLLALVALLVYLDDPGPIFYTQTRRGSEKGIRRTSEPARGC
jgi:lipopolysaccharide/colanic/teichoic acid biosynthesis glycosyltransferase